jgi:acyl-CoA dehydrogenase
MSGPANPLPVEALGDYLRAQGLAGSAPLEVRVLAGGQSNPTYRVTAGEGRDYVLRKKPPGTLIASAACSWTSRCQACIPTSAAPSTAR